LSCALLVSANVTANIAIHYQIARVGSAWGEVNEVGEIPRRGRMHVDSLSCARIVIKISALLARR